MDHAPPSDTATLRAPVGAPSRSEVVLGPGLSGTLAVPGDALGLVIFAHGSGSSRHSPRNVAVAAALQDAGFATLLADLLTVGEDVVDRVTGAHRFDIGLLGRRTVDALRWTANRAELRDLPIGLFGASTGAAAALVAAAAEPTRVRAVVSRGGRPDLAGGALTRVHAPTRLIVGGADAPVIALNREALAHLRCVRDLVVVPRATHLFEEPGALEQVADLAAEWFLRWLPSTSPRGGARADSP
jgi:putative phosphoribosyl transferase